MGSNRLPAVPKSYINAVNIVNVSLPTRLIFELLRNQKQKYVTVVFLIFGKLTLDLGKTPAARQGNGSSEVKLQQLLNGGAHNFVNTGIK